VPFMRWDDFCRMHPRAHLIVARVAANGEERPDDESIALLRQLVVRLRPRGDYALQADEGDFHLAMETDYDRDRVRSEFSAEADPSPDGWASSSAFSFDPDAWRARLAALDEAGRGA
jgi:hypothetical protein